MTAYDLVLSSGAAIAAYVGAGADPVYIAVFFIISIFVVLAALAIRRRRAHAAADAAQIARTVELERQAKSLARALKSAQSTLHAAEKERDFARVVRLVDEMRIACLQRRADHVERQNAELEARAAAAKQELMKLEEMSTELLRQRTTAEHEKGKLGDEAKRLGKAVEAYESFVVAIPSDEHEDDDITLTAPSTCGSHMSFVLPSSSSLKSRPVSPSRIPRLQPARAKSGLPTPPAPAMKPERTSSRGRILFSTSPGRLSSMMGKKGRPCEQSTASTNELKKMKSMPATQKRVWRF
ncbi:hypothetical protein EV714DRAFT_208451 [Schizophyllum commune]